MTQNGHNRVARAVLQTLHYADIFGFPLTRDELERFLIGVRASDAEIWATCMDLHRREAAIAWVDRFLTLRGRQSIVAERLRLRRQAERQAPRARRYGQLLGFLPFVRMVALTGALAMQNARDGDIDFLIVCAPGRLWTVRGLAVLLVRLARLCGDQVCPNFLLAENRLTIAEENLYNAHEIVQMIPLYGFEVYGEFRRANLWVKGFLPNADGIARQAAVEEFPPVLLWLKRVAERLLSGRMGQALERWEMSRKVRKLAAQASSAADGVEFSSEACRGFLNGHASRIMAEFERRTRDLEQEPVQKERVAA